MNERTQRTSAAFGAIAARIKVLALVSTITKNLPIIISIAALSFSFWTFYFKDIRVKNGLVLVPAESSFPPTIGGLAPDAVNTQTLPHRVLLMNDGNRSTAVLSVALRLHTRAPGETPDLARLCPSDPYADVPGGHGTGWNDVPGEAEALPAIVEPGKIVSVPLSFDLQFSEEQARAQKVPVCLRVLALDSAGMRHDRVYPYSVIDIYTRAGAPGTVTSGPAGSADSGRIQPEQLRLIGP